MTTPEPREKRPLSGPNYVPRNGVTEVQRYLIHADFLPKGADDGDFGRQTHNAMVEFQKYAMKPERMKRNTGKIEKTDKVLNKAEADGVCESATRDELIRWFQNNWIKPEPNLREGDFDNVGVQNSKGRKGDPDHIEGSYVYDLQEFLAAVNAYHGKIDGWFGAVTKKALKLYQEHAAQGKFIDEHGTTVQHPTEESLKGHVAGVGDVKTRAHLKTVVEKKLKVPYVSKLTDSVGQGGGNKPEDVKIVKKKLKANTKESSDKNNMELALIPRMR